MSGAIPPLSQYVFMAWYLVKHRDNFTFTFTMFSPRSASHPRYRATEPMMKQRAECSTREGGGKLKGKVVSVLNWASGDS
jgi:hypothetical protein